MQNHNSLRKQTLGKMLDDEATCPQSWKKGSRHIHEIMQNRFFYVML